MVLVYGFCRADEMTESRMLTAKNCQNFGRFEAFGIGVAEKMRGKNEGKRKWIEKRKPAGAGFLNQSEQEDER